MWDKFSSSLSMGASSCSFLPFKKNVGGPFGNTTSRNMSTFGSPLIGNSAGVVSWFISAS